MKHSRARGVTLIEVLITVAVVAILTAVVVAGMGATTNARVRHAATTIAAAVRVAYARASATGKPSRLVFDLDAGRIALEEGSGPMLVTGPAAADKTGGAAGETDEERAAIAEAEKILKGPRAKRVDFRPVKMYGFDAEGGGKALERGVKLKGVETTHAPDLQTEGRAYLYFWPGGWTERAAIRVGRAGVTDRDEGFTILVAPLTGKVRTLNGQQSMPTVGEGGEREDRGGL